jgi:hypothetical protein
MKTHSTAMTTPNKANKTPKIPNASMCFSKTQSLRLFRYSHHPPNGGSHNTMKNIFVNFAKKTPKLRASLLTTD